MSYSKRWWGTIFSYHYFKILSNEEEDDETLHDEYEELFNDHALALKEIKSLQKKLHDSESDVLELNSHVHKLLNENESLMLEIKDNDRFEKNEKTLRVQNESLTKENERLQKALSNFSKGQKSFDMFISSQRMMFDRKGFSFERMQNIKQKYSINYFVKASTTHTCTSTPPSSSTHNTCTYYQKRGHVSTRYRLRKLLEYGSLVPK